MASSIPSDIASYLTPDEKVVIVGNSQREVYVTNKRLIIKKRGVFGGKEIVDASYRHISSIEYEKEIPLRYVVAGVFVMVFGLLLSYFSPLISEGWFWEGDILSNMLYIVSIGLDIGGIILILMGVFLSLGPPVFTLHVVGREPIEIRGKRLEELIRIARQYREETTVSEKETP